MRTDESAWMAALVRWSRSTPAVSSDPLDYLPNAPKQVKIGDLTANALKKLII